MWIDIHVYFLFIAQNVAYYTYSSASLFYNLKYVLENCPINTKRTIFIQVQSILLEG